MIKLHYKHKTTHINTKQHQTIYNNSKNHNISQNDTKMYIIAKKTQHTITHQK